MNWQYWVDIFNTILLFYSVFLLCFYFFLAYVSVQETKKYIRKSKFTDYTAILASPLSPSVSIIAPAFNEGLTIIDNIKSLTNIHYANYDVIVVNDGSTDESMDKLTEAYQLEKIPYAVHQIIPTKKIKGIYRSALPNYKNLLVVDKENGGKADALNVGLNISRSDYVACIDVDCVLEPDALLKMVKPFLETGKEKVIATGGVVRIANNCKITSGRISEINLPKKMLPRFQVLEYVRSFMLGRMAWSRLNGLLIISGAFGMFDRKIAIEAGGYNTKTVGEDMEIVVRIRRMMHDRKIPYKVVYIPDPLCWTEAPQDIKSLLKQRNRWTRGTFETLWIHRKMMFNNRYGNLGYLSMPFWLLFEWLAPLVEFFGVLYFALLLYLGAVDWVVACSLLIAVYCFSLMYSLGTIYFEERVYHQYQKKRDFIRLVSLSFVEFFLFHPIIVLGAILGNFDLLRRKKSWGQPKRRGFAKAVNPELTS